MSVTPKENFDGIGAFVVEVSHREVLLYLFEKRLNLPSAAVYRHDCVQKHVEVICQKRYEFRLLAFLDVNVRDNPGDVVDAVFAEHHYLFKIIAVR